jgi:hypothetical protein
MFGAMPETRTVEVPYDALCQAAGVLDGLTRALEHAARYGPGFSASAAQDAAALRKLRAELLPGQPGGGDWDAGGTRRRAEVVRDDCFCLRQRCARPLRSAAVQFPGRWSARISGAASVVAAHRTGCEGGRVLGCCGSRWSACSGQMFSVVYVGSPNCWASGFQSARNCFLACMAWVEACSPAA